MNVIALNYVTETFTFIRLAVLAGWSWFQDILTALGFSWAAYCAVIVGFACVGYVVTQAMMYFKGDNADSVVSRTGQRQQALHREALARERAMIRQSEHNAAKRSARRSYFNSMND